jgi:mono/diheme cytochrome c family protein
MGTGGGAAMSQLRAALGDWFLTLAGCASALGCTRSTGEKVAPTVEPAEAPSAPVAAPATPAVPDTTRDNLLVTEAEYQGWKYYAVYCERCHAPDAVGTADAPDLRYSISEEGQVSPDSFRVIVRKGTENRAENKVMKGFEGVLDDQRIDQIYAYILARSEERLAAGRPHRASAQ